MPVSVLFNAAVEGITDEAVVRRILSTLNCRLYEVYGKSGKKDIQAKIENYNNAARHMNWIVLIDLNHEAACAPELISKWLNKIEKNLCFRVAVREVESWLMADREALSKYLKIPEAKIPSNPDSLEWPKREMVNLARNSSSKSIVSNMVPRQGSGRVIGQAYPACMIEFATNHWRPLIAAKNSDSLKRCINTLKRTLRT